MNRLRGCWREMTGAGGSGFHTSRRFGCRVSVRTLLSSALTAFFRCADLSRPSSLILLPDFLPRHPRMPSILPRTDAAALHVYVRRLESPDDLGGPPPENAPRKRVKKAAAPSPRPPSELFFSPASASQSPLLQQSAQPPAGGVQPLWQPPFHPSF